MNVNRLCKIVPVGHYEAKLGSDPQILSCAKVFTNAAAGKFGVRGRIGDASTSAPAVNSATNNLCPSSESVARGRLANFHTTCSEKLTLFDSQCSPTLMQSTLMRFSAPPACCSKSSAPDDGNHYALEVGPNLRTSSPSTDGPWLPLIGTQVLTCTRHADSPSLLISSLVSSSSIRLSDLLDCRECLRDNQSPFLFGLLVREWISSG